MREIRPSGSGEGAVLSRPYLINTSPPKSNLYYYFRECCFAEKNCSGRKFEKLINTCSAGSLKSG